MGKPQTASMLRKPLFVLAVLAALPLCAQQTPANASDKPAVQMPNLADVEKRAQSERLAKEISAAYYHPDNLGSIDCNVSLDWTAFLSQLHVDTSTDDAKERMKQLQNVKIHAHSVRDKAAEITLDWNGVDLPGKDSIDGGIKQVAGGFYQTYWATYQMADVKLSTVTKVEPLADGASNVYLTDSGTNLVVTVDGKGIPTRYAFDNPAMKGAIDMKYVATENPKPDDLRRISEADIAQQVGESSIKIAIKMDYQPVDSFYIPHHVLFDIPGAYSMAIEFTSCTVTKI